MYLLIWIIFGAISGWIASAVMKTAPGNLLGNIILGIMGAAVGGFMMNFLGLAGVTGVDIYSLIVSVIGACTVIWIARRIL